VKIVGEIDSSEARGSVKGTRPFSFNSSRRSFKSCQMLYMYVGRVSRMYQPRKEGHCVVLKFESTQTLRNLSEAWLLAAKVATSYHVEYHQKFILSK
jgi:hypothetical protein